jgi:DNA polymerase elongation subunit (family B)
MLQNINLNELLFIDIETAPKAPNYNDLGEYEQILWEEKRGKLRAENESIEDYFFNNAGILAEFGKIICISVGTLNHEGLFNKYESISFFGDDEIKILSDFSSYIDKILRTNPKITMCGHNIKEFDIPYICRRYIINNQKIPKLLLNLQSKKPWENGLVDTMDLWKFGDYKNFISLKLLAHCLGIPSPKDDISGKDVGKVYWHEKGLERIKTYCEKDVLTVANVILKLKGLPLIN